MIKCFFIIIPLPERSNTLRVYMLRIHMNGGVWLSLEKFYYELLYIDTKHYYKYYEILTFTKFRLLFLMENVEEIFTR